MFRHTEGKKPSNSGRCLAYCAIDNGAEQDGIHEAKDEETEETGTMFIGLCAQVSTSREVDGQPVVAPRWYARLSNL